MIMRRLLSAFLMMAAIGNAASGEEPLLTYDRKGGRSPYKHVSVIITPSGIVTVTGEKRGLPPVEYRTELSREEVATFHVLICSTEFFSQPDHDKDQRPPVISHAGESVLTVNADGKHRTLTYFYRPSVEPLTQPIWKLITQAFAVQAIETGDIYTAIGAVMPTDARMKALQPNSLKGPCMSYIRNHDDRPKVALALEALSCITTPEEFCGFVWTGVKDQNQRDMFLRIIGAQSFYHSIPDSHAKALCPLYLSFVRDAHPRMASLSDTEEQALSAFTYLLGELRYEPAIPLLKMWFEEHDQPYITTPLLALSKMGDASLRALRPYLDRPEESFRLNAIELLMCASRLGPNCGYANPLSSYEYEQMIPVFKKSVIPRLCYMSENDPSDKVEEKASEALKEIRKNIEKEKMALSK